MAKSLKRSDKVWVVKHIGADKKLHYGAFYWEKKPSTAAYSAGFSPWTKPRPVYVTVATAIKHGCVVGRPRGIENLLKRVKR